MSWDKELKLKQLDDLIHRLKPKERYKKPKIGWIKLIRTTIAMSARVLGKRVGLTQSRIALIEKGEVNGTITLQTLEKIADGLECEVIYLLVPKDESLAKLREKQAYYKATTLNSYAEHHMALENQSTSPEYQRGEIEKAKDEYLKNWHKNLWEE